MLAFVTHPLVPPSDGLDAASLLLEQVVQAGRTPTGFLETRGAQADREMARRPGPAVVGFRTGLFSVTGMLRKNEYGLWRRRHQNMLPASGGTGFLAFRSPLGAGKGDSHGHRSGHRGQLKFYGIVAIPSNNMISLIFLSFWLRR